MIVIITKQKHKKQTYPMNTNFIIPQNLMPIASILSRYFQPLLQWFSDYVYTRLIPPHSTHLLPELDRLLDFSPLEAACADYHKCNGKGRPVAHPVPHLLRAILVKYLYDFSLRQLEDSIRYDLMVKSFVGYPVFASGPDHTTLERFEMHLVFYHPRLFFDTILDQIDAAFPEERRRTQIGDTFIMHANAAMESLIKRIRHTAQALLAVCQAADPDAYAALWPHLPHTALFGSAHEPKEYALSVDEWRERLLVTVDAALLCLTLVRQAGFAHPDVALWLGRMEKILGDELRLERDENGRLIGADKLPEKKRGKYRICSATDPDATIRNHGPGKSDLGFNVSVLATTHFIREIQADTGSRPDADPLPELLQAQQEYHHCQPEKLVYDQAAGRGKTAFLVEQASNGRTQLVVKPIPAQRKNGRFAPEDFTLSQDGLSLTCPNGRISCRKYRSGSGDGATFRFMPPQCRGCSFLKPCRGRETPPVTHRDVFISDYRVQWEALLAYSQTEEFKQDMKLRPEIERIIAGLTLHNGVRRARFRGQVKSDFQVKMGGTAYNLKRWVALRRGKRPKKRRRLAAPLPNRLAPPGSGGEVGLAFT
jgi:hypothetical protein